MRAISDKIAEVPDLAGKVVRGVTPVGYDDSLPIASIYEDYEAMRQARLAPSQPKGANQKLVHLPVNVVAMLSQSNSRAEDYDRSVILMYEVIEKLNEGRLHMEAPNRRAPFGLREISSVEIGSGSAQDPNPAESVNHPHFVIPLVISYVEA